MTFCTSVTVCGGRRLIGISGSLIWSKTVMELMFNPCGEFRWSPEGPVSQIHYPHLLVGASGIFSDLLRYVQTLKRERVGCGKQRGATAPTKSLVKLQPWFLSFRWKTCLRQNCSLGFSACNEVPAFGQNTLLMMTVCMREYTCALPPGRGGTLCINVTLGHPLLWRVCFFLVWICYHILLQW